MNWFHLIAILWQAEAYPTLVDTTTLSTNALYEKVSFAFIARSN